MKFQEIIDNIDVWYNWIDQYKKFVPKFIEEAKTKANYSDWDKSIFNEFFEKNRDQCVSSLQQGYYTHNEKQLIKENWLEIAPYLKKIAENQNTLDLETYKFIKNWFRKHTTQNRKASANRIIASLQPNLLCTIVNEDRLVVLMRNINNISSVPVFKISNNWFINSNAILQYFKDNIPHKDIMDLITYPWQTYDYFINKKTILTNNDMSEENNYKEIINLLEYKKQIILQGPPGTGKTRLAKEIAKEMIPVTSEFIKNKITVGKIIPTAKGQVSYKVLSVTEEKIVLEREKGTINDTTISRIIAAFEEQKWNNEIKNNDDRMAVALAKYLFDDFFADNEQFKLIQFHPSYTYEDFVRGIVAESKGDKIEYKNVNKTLGEFAELALKNYNDSKKNVNELSTEKWIDDEFTQFVDEISQTLEKEKIVLSDNVDLVDLMDDAFLYIGENWKGYEHRMSFKDIKRAYLDNNITRQDIVKNINLSGSARQHATYYIVVLKKFREFLSEKKAPTNQTKINEQKYILVIDEINRANLSSVLGELIYALEYRGEEVESMYEVDGSQKLILPPNLYIIGTMNTADRSVGHIDYAIRRRFAFVDVLPEKLEDTKDIFFNTPGFVEVAKLFIKVGEDGVINFENAEDSDFLANDFSSKDVALGHSYFIADRKKISEEEKDNFFKMKMKYEVIPILNEYLRDGVFNESATAKIKDIEQRFA
ncbi:AAA family ATPase [Epilithonimonas sp.]|uniref:AAA family ATPase n=1 Tax=Epilithonimonas sp. TaxID=2894511 RepID=UPI002897FBB6|nr:AAA family ATPase [Epilithonimonas sp.]